MTHIESTPERVWHALTAADLTAAYWGHRNVSDWRAGSSWEHVRVDGSGIADVVGTVLEAAPPHRMVITFDAPGEQPPEHGEIVRVTVPHENLSDKAAFDAISGRLANLESLLETGHVLPLASGEMSRAGA